MTSQEVEQLNYYEAGVAALSGGLASFVVSLTVLWFLRLKAATHFCNSSVLYAFIISQCAQSIVFTLQGSLVVTYIAVAPRRNAKFGDPTSPYSGGRIALRAIEEFTFLSSTLLAILMFNDSFQSFRNPFKRRRNVYIFIAVAYGLAFSIILALNLAVPCHYLVVLFVSSLRRKVLSAIGSPSWYCRF
jgi:hypothetical protein